MSLLQRTEVYQKARHSQPAFEPSGLMISDVTEVPEPDGNVLIGNVPDHVLERAVDMIAISFVIGFICVWFALAILNVMFPDDLSLVSR
jgi:hypothetical protein